MKNKYAFQEIEENMARAMVKDAQISTKVSIEIASFLRGKTTKKALQLLNNVLKKKTAIPFKRFTDGVGHRAGAGIGAGRFPQKASQEFIALIKNAEANAQAKGLSENLKIIHLIAHKASNQFHYGRQSRRKYKRTHLEIVVEEQEEVKEEKKTVKKKQTPKKTETKSETAKQDSQQKKEENKESKTEAKEKPKTEEKKNEESKSQEPKTEEKK